MGETAIVVKVYQVLRRAIEEGARIGVNRSYKYTDTPSREDIVSGVTTEIMAALDEVVDFGD